MDSSGAETKKFLGFTYAVVRSATGTKFTSYAEGRGEENRGS